MKKSFLFSLLLLTSPLVAAEPTFPQPDAYVTDQAGVLSPGTENSIEALLARFEQASTIQVAVVTIGSLEGSDITDYANRLFKAWGIGQKGKDNGVLFLIAPNDRKARIEVGYGLEGVLNDALTGRILDEAVVPQFRAGDIDAGVLAGTNVLCRIIAEKSNISFDGIEGMRGRTPLQPKKMTLGQAILTVIVLIFAIFVFIQNPWLFLLLLSRGGHGGGGFGGGGFGGFGGGGSGGGGASRGW